MRSKGEADASPKGQAAIRSGSRRPAIHGPRASSLLTSACGSEAGDWRGPAERCAVRVHEPALEPAQGALVGQERLLHAVQAVTPRAVPATVHACPFGQVGDRRRARPPGAAARRRLGTTTAAGARSILTPTCRERGRLPPARGSSERARGSGRQPQRRAAHQAGVGELAPCGCRYGAPCSPIWG